VTDLNFDAVVVGAGPCGLMAGKALAEGGASVLILERKQEIGTPKRCAEGVNIIGLEKVGLSPDPRWAVNEITAAAVYAPNGRKVTVDIGGQHGFILERKIFEKDLARMAVDAGARVMVKTQVTGVLKEDGKVAGVTASFMGEDFKVNCKLLIAADGVDSQVAQWAGMPTLNKLTDYHSGFQYEMAGVKGAEENALHIFFGNRIAPKGYAWIFPKGGGVANVGIGVLGSECEGETRARKLLDGFIAANPKFFENASPIEVNAGGVPVSAGLENLVLDGFMVAGDAAQQVNPIHGGGIAIALLAGKIAGEVAAESLKEGDVSADRLRVYEARWREAEGGKLAKLLKLRHFMEKLSDDDFNALSEILPGDSINKLTGGDFAFLAKALIKKPRLLNLARKIIL